MRKFSEKKIKILMIIICSVLIFMSNIRASYADNVTYTRLQLQNAVLATAVTYLYNNEYSDYSQKSMDGGTGKYNVDVFWKKGDNDNPSRPTYIENKDEDSLNNWSITYPFRTFLQSPDSASRTNRFFIDCSSFAMSTYLYSLGFDFSEYAYKSQYPNLTARSYYSNGGKHFPLGNSDCTTAACDQSRINLFKKSYKYYNARVLSTESLVEYARGTIKDGEPTVNTTYSVNKNSGSIDNKFVVYFREVEDVTASQLDTIKSDMNEILRPGDLIVRRKYDDEDNDSGHVVVYVGSKLGDTRGIIEAKGTGMYRGSYYGDQTYGKNATGKDAYSIRYTSNWYSLLEQEDNDYLDYPLMQFLILRPINAFCSQKGNQSDASSEQCTVPDSSSSETYSAAQANISKARLRFRFQKIRREQYAMSGAYKSDGTTNDGKLLGKYNSVSPGDKITYHLELTNNSTWKGSSSNTVSIGDDSDAKNIFKVTAKVPADADYVDDSCKGATSCSESDGTITWTGIKTSGTDKLSYSVTVKDNVKGVIVNKGFTLYPPTDISGSLNLGDINVNVMPTIRKLSDRAVINKSINDFKNGSYKYNSDNGYSNCNNSTNLNSGGFVKKIYCDSYGLNLDNYNFTGSGILNNFFKTLSSSDPYDYELKTANSNTSLSKMLVPGMYGGTLLRGNDYKDSNNYADTSGNNISMNRIKYMTESDFEVGDIIVYYTFGSNATKTNASPMSTFYIYAGNNQFVSFLSGGFTVKNNDYDATTGTGSETISYKNKTDVFTDSDAKDYFVRSLYNKALFVVLRPSQAMTTVKYNFNGGAHNRNYLLFLASGKYNNIAPSTSITPPNPYTVTYAGTTGATCDKCSTNNKTGTLSFKEWQTLNNKVVNGESDLVTTATHTVKAIWQGNVTLPSISKKGYQFKGWKSSVNNNTYSAGTTVTLNSSATMTAQWNIQNYTITYKLNGGKVSTANPGTYTVDTADIKLNNPTKTNYKFIGWTGSNGTTPQTNVTISKGSTGNKNYVANYELIVNKVSFNTNGGSSVQEQSIGYGAKATIPVTPSKSGVAFEGWYKNEEMTDRYDFKTPVVEPVTLNAKWIEDKYQITYDLAGGYVDNQTYYDEDTATFTLENPEKEGYTFEGWTGTNGTTPQMRVDIEQGSSGNMNYTANYSAKEYTISFNVDGMEEMKVKCDAEIEIPTPTREGYTFKGWYNDEDLTEEFTDTTMPSNDLTLYAKWEANTYKIIFETNEGEEIPPRQVAYDTEIGDLTTPIKSGYTFKGWYLDKDLTEEFKAEKMPAKDITLYAKWEKEKAAEEIVLNVPNTASNQGILIYIMSMIAIISGIVIILYVTQRKNQQVNS